MRTIKSYWRNMVWKSQTLLRVLSLKTLTISCLLVLSLLTGCQKNPTIDEATTYLEAKALEVQINTYKLQLKQTKESLTTIIPLLEENIEKPIPLISGLVDFLSNNECEYRETREELVFCYKLTRLNLIHTTSALEGSNNKYYASKVTIQQLIDNINTIIDAL